MKPTFKVGDHVEWNSEVGRVRGTIVMIGLTKVLSAMHHAFGGHVEKPSTPRGGSR
jgi:hypothetical protein